MKRLVRIVVICYLSYLAVVLVVITPALNFLPSWAAKKYLGRELHSEIIYFNPFTLSLELHSIELPEPDGKPFASFDRATINLSLASLWSGALVFDELGVKQLYMNVIERPDGNFNFSDMLPAAEPEAPPPEPAGIPAITIHHFEFNSRQLVFTSEAREKPFSTNLNGINITVHGLSTVLEEDKPYSLDATGDNGGTLHWEGLVSIPNSSSEGMLALTDIQLHPAWRFVEPWVAFELGGGTLSVAGQYKVDWSAGLDYWISGGAVRFDALAVHPQNPGDLPDTDITLGALKLSGIELDGPARHARVDSFTVDELAVNGWSKGDRVSLVDLFAMKFPGETTATATTAPAEPEASGEPGWTAGLGSFKLADSSLRWRSEYTDPGQLEVTPIEASASAINWPLEGDTALKLSLTINGQSSAAIEGSLDLARGTGKLTYQLEALPLPWFSPNLPAALNAEVTDGQLNIAGEIALADYLPLSVAMDGSITGFAGKVRQAETSLTSWETVRWEKLLLDMEKHQVELALLAIDNYTGRIHIHKDGSINAQNIWKKEVGTQAEAVQEDMAQGDPWGVDVPLIQITDSEIDFMDESLPIPFRAVIGDLNGDIKGVSSQAGAKTHVDIKGSVDGYAPVVLVGTAEPLRTPPAIDLELTFDGVDMALLSPYSSKYAGYAIERGVLNLDLKYSMEDDLLKGQNKIVINQMKLGKKIASDKAVDLPLELALALLTDSKGVINMQVPVSGNVNNPEFSVGSVVMGALTNLIAKAVTSPFTLLAGLVNSEADLQRLNFTSGSADLRDSTKEKLRDLSTAMTKRPELGLVIVGRLQLEEDRERLQKNLLQAQMVAAGLTEAEYSTKSPAWEEAIKQRYQALAPGDTELSVRGQYLALAQSIPLPDSELLALADARAVAVKSYLVNETGLGPERAAIGKSSLDAKANLYSGAELEIDI